VLQIKVFFPYVILSEVADPLRGSATQSKDPFHLDAIDGDARSF
jgi:hypothetical protein